MCPGNGVMEFSCKSRPTPVTASWGTVPARCTGGRGGRPGEASCPLKLGSGTQMAHTGAFPDWLTSFNGPFTQTKVTPARECRCQSGDTLREHRYPVPTHPHVLMSFLWGKSKGPANDQHGIRSSEFQSHKRTKTYNQTSECKQEFLTLL